MISNLFLESVETAVAESLQTNKILVVYNTEGTDNWLNAWFQIEKKAFSQLKEAAVWLKLLKGSTQFNYFEQIFPNVVVPSIYFVLNGQIKSTIQGEPTDNHWNDLLNTLQLNGKIETPIKSSSNVEKEKIPAKKSNDKPFKEQVQETSQEIYHDKVLKERKADKEERERILKLLQADKEERNATKQQGPTLDAKSVEVRDNIKDRSRLHTEKCTLQIRLTNSETLTRTFISKDTLNDVRTWVDINRTDGDHPYAFHRNIPRFTFTESDEMKTLEELELTPRSALILKPLENTIKRLNVTDIQQPGLLGKVYTGFSSWWGGEPQQQDSIPREFSANSNESFPQRREPSETNLTSRSVTPNVYQLVNADDLDDSQEKSTYNGNNIKLEKKKDE